MELDSDLDPYPQYYGDAEHRKFILNTTFYDHDLIKCCKKIDSAENVGEKMNVLIFYIYTKILYKV